MDHVPQVGKISQANIVRQALGKVELTNVLPSRRHADRTVQIWLQRLKDSASHKRLNLLYLANGNILLHPVAAATKMMRSSNVAVRLSQLLTDSISHSRSVPAVKGPA